MRNNLARIRGRHGLTQEALASMIGVSKQGLSFNEVGKISLKTAKAVAEALDENVFEVLGSDVLVTLPKTEADKEYLRKTIAEILGD